MMARSLTKEEARCIFEKAYRDGWEDCKVLMLEVIGQLHDMFMPHEATAEMRSDFHIKMDKALEYQVRQRWPEVWIEIRRMKQIGEDVHG